MSLVLSRQEGDSVILFTESGEVVTITLDLLQKSQAKLTFDAPRSVKILRGELVELGDRYQDSP